VVHCSKTEHGILIFSRSDEFGVLSGYAGLLVFLARKAEGVVDSSLNGRLEGALML
jgi:hypothetical protein